MINNETISQALTHFEFVGYARTTQRLLSAYGIVEPTIAKIVNKIENNENGPFYVYRRAVIYCIDDEYQSVVAKTKESMPLTIVLQPTQIVLINKQFGKISCPYAELTEYLD